MTDSVEAQLVSNSGHVHSNRQSLFLRYFTAILVDLVVLNLFVEYAWYVDAASFTVTLFAALLLQVLLKLTIAVEHRVAAYFKAMEGGFATFMRFFTAWLLLFVSKFVIFGILNFAFGDSLVFSGAWHGVIALIGVITALVIAEELLVRFYRRLG